MIHKGSEDFGGLAKLKRKQGKWDRFVLPNNL
jgi:hypothetical protein